MSQVYNAGVSAYHNDEAENSVLGAVFIDNTAMDEINTMITRESFYRESTRYIYDAMLHLHERAEAIDVVTVTDRLVEMNVYEAVGGAHFLTQLSNEVPSAANVLHYANIMRRKHVTRQLVTHGDEMRQMVESATYEELIAYAEDEPTRILSQIQQTRTHRLSDLMYEAMDRWEAITRGEQRATGLLSGIRSLDEILGGAYPDQLITVAGRPAMGKSSLANNWAVNIAKGGDAVGFISLEMEARKIVERALCAEAEVNSRRLKEGTLDSKGWQRLGDQIGKFGEYGFHVDDTPRMTLAQFNTLARRWVLRDKVRAIFVDYLQLMQAPGARSREQEISEISRTLKGTARELHIPVIALAQLSRKLEERADKRPLLSDIRESGAIEQDSDVVIFTYRDHVYNPGTPASEAELNVAKHREGPTGIAHAGWDGAHTRFVNARLF
jgi:replicative DNA helicase